MLSQMRMEDQCTIFRLEITSEVLILGNTVILQGKLYGSVRMDLDDRWD